MVLVSCGKCSACLQEKANKRANRIRNNFKHGYVALFITLTYTNNFVPFVRKSEILNTKDYDDINVYRSASGRWSFSRWNGYKFNVSNKEQVIERVLLTPEMRNNLSSLKPLKGKSKDCVGVCIYKDIQDFFKRLRQYLVRHDYTKEFTYFSCSEFGGCTFRPHFHALLFVRAEDEKIFRDAILTSWPYADVNRTAQYIELARDPASYVSSYVNGNFSLSPLLQDSHFKPKCSMSKHFGVVLDCFSLASILEKIDRGALHYYSPKKFDGTSVVIELPVPKYVLGRFFPFHKGFSWLSESQLFNILLKPEKVYEYLCSSTGSIEISSVCKNEKSCINIPFECQTKLDNSLYSYSPKECHRIVTNLNNCYEKFLLETGLSRYDYAHYYLRAWRIYSSQIIKDSLLSVDKIDDFKDYYENGNELNEHPEWCPSLDFEFESDPNKRHDIVERTTNLMRIYDLCDKTKKVTNYFMSETGHNV